VDMKRKKASKRSGGKNILVLLLLLLLALLLRHARKPVKTDRSADVEDDESPQDAKVAPAVGVAGVDRGEEDVGAGIRAEAAGFHVVCVAGLERARFARRAVLGQVVVASLASWGRELDVFVLGAGDSVAGEADAEHAGDEVGERGDSVHEDPEARKCAWGSDDTAEDEAEREHEVGNVATCLCIGDTGDDHVCEGGREQEELQREEEEEGTTLVFCSGVDGVVVEADRVVEAHEDDDSHKSVPGQFNGDVGDHESLPGVGSARALTNLVQGTLSDEVRHDLLNKLTEDSEQKEDREHLVLKTLLGKRSAEEDKSNEDGRTKT
jgi:hypothetical protein